MGDRLRVEDVFGPTVQGEGPAAGRSAGFVRLMGCNLSCNWCDEPQTWDTSRHNLRATTQLLTVDQILQRLPNDVAVYVVTGGEPLLQQHSPALAGLLTVLAEQGEVHIETNGTIAPMPAITKQVTTWVVSPKLSHAGPHRGHQDPALHPAWSGGAHGAHLKIVCRDVADVTDAIRIADSVAWPRRRVWLMPEGITPGVLSRRWPAIATAAAQRGVNATHRLHILANVP